MAKNKKDKMSRSQRRSIRTQQIIMGIIGVIVILSMVLALIAR
jgi:predicted nucleic acid-binding Zn ribbon protein